MRPVWRLSMLGLGVFCAGQSARAEAPCFDPGTIDRDGDGTFDGCELLHPYAFDYIEQRAAGGANEAGDGFGEALLTADFNGDGIADLVVGAPSEGDAAGVRSGAVFFYPGTSTGIGAGTHLFQASATRGGVAERNETGDRFGATLAVGHFDGDAFADLAVGAPGENEGAGMVFIFHGSAEGLSTSDATWFRFGHIASPERTDLNVAGNRFGAALLAVDVDNDGDDDLVVGAPGDTQGAGAIAVLRSEESLGDAAGLRFVQRETAPTASNEPGDAFGSSLTSGDFNGDGLFDVAIGAPGEDANNSTFSNGEGVFSVMLGREGAAPVASTFRRQTACNGTRARGDHFGTVLTSGDFDGDSLSDLVVSAPGDAIDGEAVGSLCVFSGAQLGSAGVAGWTGQSFDQAHHLRDGTNEAGDLFAASLAAGDFDKDGFDDLAVGIPGKALDGHLGAGMVATLSGSSTGLSQGKLTRQAAFGLSDEADDQFGFAVAVGDLDGSGADDLLVGAPGEVMSGEGKSGFVTMQMGTGHAVTMLSLGPLLGAVTSTSANIWVRANRAANYTLRFRVLGTTPFTTPDLSVSLSSARDFTGTYALTGLLPDTQYEYEVLLDGQPRARALLRTLAASPQKITFGVAADFAWGKKPFTVLDALAQDKPRFALFIGDNIYADGNDNSGAGSAVTQAQYEDRYIQNWGDPAMRAFMSTVPTLMTWDDHEIANNWNQGFTPPRFKAAKAAFDFYQAAHNPAPFANDFDNDPGTPDGGTLYFRYKVGSLLDFFVLDLRSYRTAATAPSPTLLGSRQLTHLKQWLSTSTATFKVIVSAVPFADRANTDEDAWKDYPAERAAVYAHVRSNDLEGVVIVSGDQHWGAIYRRNIGNTANPFCVAEFQATPAGQSIRPVPVTSDDTICDTRKLIYGRFVADASVSPAKLTVSYCDIKGSCSCRATITTSQLGSGTTCPVE